MVVAVWSAFELARWRAKREGLDQEQVADLTFFIILTGLVGARAFYVWEVWGKKGMTTIVDAFAIWNGGIVLYGSLLGAAIGFGIYRLLRPMPMLRTLDVFAPSLALGAAFGRIGCFLNGCCYGDRCDLPCCGVNMGNHTAAILTNKALVRLLYDTGPDDKMDDTTIESLNRVNQSEFIDAFEVIVMRHYNDIVTKNPKDAKFLYGWSRRAGRLLTLR